MTGWIGDPERKGLVRSEPDLELVGEPKPKLELEL